MKFSIGEKVIIKNSLRVGTVKHYKHEIYQEKGRLIEKFRYAVDTGKYYSDWCEESDIRSYDEYTKEFEIGLLELLVDVNLKVNNIEEVKRLHSEKMRLMKG